MTEQELPRDYMARAAQFGRRGIFQYREELIAGMEQLRFIGAVFADEETARRWDDRPGRFHAWFAFDSWECAEAWLFSEGEVCHGGRLHQSLI